MAITYKLEAEDGTPVEPRAYRSAVQDWGRSDTIPMGHGRPRWLFSTCGPAATRIRRLSSSCPRRAT
jgi:hypothetical protein